MINIILTGAAGVLFLAAFSFLLVWLDERSKIKARKKASNRFLHFDKYYYSLKGQPEGVAGLDVSAK